LTNPVGYNGIAWEKRMIPKSKVELRLTGTQFSPEEITNLIGVSPTRVFRMGESIQGTKLTWKSNGWCYSLNDYKDTYDLGEEISVLLDRINVFSKKIIEVCEEKNLFSEISCAVYMKDETPAINLNQQIIAQLNEFKTTIDVDIILTA
jgi:hypothetical protein